MTPRRGFLAAARLRLVLAVAGLAWLLGLQLPAGGRVLAAVLVLAAIALDSAGTARPAPAPTRREENEL